MRLKYDKGTIAIDGELRIPQAVWDARTKCQRAEAMKYSEILEYLHRSKIIFDDNVMNALPCPELKMKRTLRDYQNDALKAWARAGMRGAIVLPTGAGKTVVALAAISKLSLSTIVIVPTLDLVKQWQNELSEEFGIEVGIYSGLEKRIRSVTVTTYDTVYLQAEKLGNIFELVVFDEVHHLASPGYSKIGECFAARYRLGLTATYERADGLHASLLALCGGKVFELSPASLAGIHLSDYEHRVIKVELAQDEKEDYSREMLRFRAMAGALGMQYRTRDDLRRLVMRSSRDKRARDALLSRARARRIAHNSRTKLDALQKILSDHRGQRTIIFTENNAMLDEITMRFLVPAVTYRTKKTEREEILGRFRAGAYRTIASSKVLDEGIDVPSASVGIVLGGSGSRREMVQRLGRLLRKEEGKLAVLYEVVSSDTVEESSSKRRNEGERDAA